MVTKSRGENKIWLVSLGQGSFRSGGSGESGDGLVLSVPGLGCREGVPETLLGDNALPHMAYVMLILAPLIPATRWGCNCLLPADSND